jgi:tol-pal system protein YbgF
MISTGGPTAPGHRLPRGLLLGLAVALTAPACATKGDLRDLRTEMLALQAHQDSMFNDVQRQNRLLLDTLRQSFTSQQDAAGQTNFRFQQLEEQLGRTEELMYQLQVLVADVIERLDRQPAPVVQRPMAIGVDSTGAPIVTVDDGGRASEMFDSGMEKIGQSAFATARLAFQQLIEQYPQHPLAAQAQYQIGQTYVAEGDPERAIEELLRVEEVWAGAPRATAAMLQAGMLAEELDERERARQIYTSLVNRYPGEEDAREARRRLTALGG